MKLIVLILAHETLVDLELPLASVQLYVFTIIFLTLTLDK
jgi:hypothetical protein